MSDVAVSEPAVMEPNTTDPAVDNNDDDDDDEAYVPFGAVHNVVVLSLSTEPQQMFVHHPQVAGLPIRTPTVRRDGHTDVVLDGDVPDSEARHVH